VDADAIAGRLLEVLDTGATCEPVSRTVPEFGALGLDALTLTFT
jgi:hypothetical protein